MSDSDGLLREPSQALDITHHDEPSRHVIGATLLAPTTVKAVGIIGSVGISDAPAREDHVHGAGDTWHNVGAGGEPAFQNSWVNWGAPYVVCRFRKENGRVYVEGTLKSGGSSTVAWTFPVGYRPASQIQRQVRGAAAAEALTLIDLPTNGNLQIVITGGGTATAVSLGFDFALD